jgi:hypothetical protein
MAVLVTVSTWAAGGGVLMSANVPSNGVEMIQLSRCNLAAPDPLFPASTTLPLNEPGGVAYPVAHTPGMLRPFSAALGVPAPAETKKHDTANTRNTTSQRTQQSDDGNVRPDTITDTTTDT